MTKEVVSLKLDFKIDEQGIVRIIDIGDGLGADDAGFEDTSWEAKTLKYMYEATGATVATAFGELPYDAMCPESIHVPLVLREPNSKWKSSFEPKDLPSNLERILPCSQFGRITSYVSSAWGMQKDSVIITPVALMALEMHKILWYFLMQKHMPLKEQKPVIYWSNDTNPKSLKLDSLDIQNGVFIKIADRSMGGGNDVYYAKNKSELLNITTQLHLKYNASNEPYKKHVFILEPAFITLKKHQSQDYNVTGRAFITLIYDKSNKNIEVKIAAAKWMFPLKSIQTNKNQDQMLSNIKNSIQMQALTAEELQEVTTGILNSYGECFKAGFENNDIIKYCSDNPEMKLFESCLRPNSAYLIVLKEFDPSGHNFTAVKENTLMAFINGYVASHYIKGFNNLLQNLNTSNNFFPVAKLSPDALMKKICTFSFMENYVAQVKNVDNMHYQMYPFLRPLCDKESSIKSALDRLILDYLTLANISGIIYDLKDINRALRQAASVCDLTVMKLLIYTRRADVNALSPTNKTALHYATISKNENKELLEQCVLLLKQAGAKELIQQEKEPPIQNTKSI